MCMNIYPEGKPCLISARVVLFLMTLLPGGRGRVQAVGGRGKEVQIDPIKHTLKAPGINLLKLKYVKPLSKFAFKFNFRRYNEDGEEWDSNKELVGQGVANVLSAAVGGMPVAGVISRAAFGKSAGAKSQVAQGRGGY